MTEQEFLDILMECFELFDDVDGLAEQLEPYGLHLEHLHSFEEAGVLSSNKGIVLTFANSLEEKQEFQVTIVRSK